MDNQSEAKKPFDETRCKQCAHLNSFHGDDGCGTWLLGVRAVPLYRCACVVSPNKDSIPFPTIKPSGFQTSHSTPFKIHTNPGGTNETIPAARLRSNNNILNTSPEGDLTRLSEKLRTRNVLSWEQYTPTERESITSLVTALMGFIDTTQERANGFHHGE